MLSKGVTKGLRTMVCKAASLVKMKPKTKWRFMTFWKRTLCYNLNLLNTPARQQVCNLLPSTPTCTSPAPAVLKSCISLKVPKTFKLLACIYLASAKSLTLCHNALSLYFLHYSLSGLWFHKYSSPFLT